MTISPGAPAPLFTGTDLFGAPVSLADFHGGPVLLSFFRNAACALCNLRVHELISQHDRLSASGVRVVAVFESDAASLREYVGRQDAPFPILADPTGTLYDLYAVENSAEKVEATMASSTTPEVIGRAADVGFELTPQEGANMLRLPADFLIGAGGVVLAAHYASVVWDHLPLTEIDALLG